LAPPDAFEATVTVFDTKMRRGNRQAGAITGGGQVIGLNQAVGNERSNGGKGKDFLKEPVRADPEGAPGAEETGYFSDGTRFLWRKFFSFFKLSFFGFFKEIEFM